MSLTVATPPQHTSLVDVGQLRSELISATPPSDAQLEALARQVSASVETHCSQVFARAVYLETIPGYGGTRLMLSRTPLALVSSVTYDGSPVIDYVIDDPQAGTLYRELGWAWSYGLQFFLDDARAPGGESRPVAVTYTAGYLLPDDDVADAALSVAAADQSFNRVGGEFPLLVPGDTLTSSEFFNAANNGTFRVVTRTATKLTVSGGALVDEAANATGSNPKTLTVRTLPGDVERAAVEGAKARFYSTRRDPAVTSRSITGLSVTYAQGAGSALPPLATVLLAPYRRLA